MDVEDVVVWQTMVVANKSRLKDIIDKLTTILDPPRPRGVKVAPEINKQRPTRNLGIVAKRVIVRASARRKRPIQTNLDLARPNKKVGNGCTTPKDRKDPVTERAQPL